VCLDPQLTYITGVVITDSGSPFRQSVLVNVGARDGIIDGWAAMDGIGLVGRISGVGQEISRVILLTDTSSRIPVTVQPSGQRAILAGDNTLVFPPDLQVGQVARGTDGRLRVRLSADYERLKFLRVLRAQGHEVITDPGGLLAPAPQNLPAPAPTQQAADG